MSLLVDPTVGFVAAFGVLTAVWCWATIAYTRREDKRRGQS